MSVSARQTGNLLRNPGFEEQDENEVPIAWNVAAKGSLIVTHAHSGQYAVHLAPDKSVTQSVDAEPDQDYLLSVWVRQAEAGIGTYLFLNGQFLDQTGKMIQESFRCPESVHGETFQEVRWIWHTTPNTAKLAVGFRASGEPGYFLDDVRLTKIGPGIRYLSDADSIHGLAELARRRRFKPYDLIRRDGVYPSERLVFTDTATGAVIWKMTSDPHTTRHWYSNISPWSCDGRALLLWGQREKAGLWAMSSRGEAIRYMSPHYNPLWHPGKPGFFYQSVFEQRFMELYAKAASRMEMEDVVRRRRAENQTFAIVETNLDGGQRRVICEGPASSLHDISKDGRKLLLTDKTGGAIYWVDTETGEALRQDADGRVHKMWFTKEADHAVWFAYAPESRVQRPGAYHARPGAKPEQVEERSGFSHGSSSPDGTQIAYFAGELHLKKWGQPERSVISDLRGVGGHISWESDPGWFVFTMADTLYRAVATPDRGAYATRLCVPNNNEPFSVYAGEAHPELAPDGAKVGYASSMLGTIDFYSAIIRLPDPVRNLTATTSGEQVQLEWEKPAHCKETKGYFVYHSRESGGPFECLTPEPVRETFHEIRHAPGNGFFVVTPVEHSGLEGRPSREARVAANQETVKIRHYYEIEDGTVSGPLLLDFDGTAAGLYGVWLPELFDCPTQRNRREVHDHGVRYFVSADADDRSPAGGVDCVLEIPRNGSYNLWLRAKSVFLHGTVAASMDGKSLGTWTIPSGNAWKYAPLKDRCSLMFEKGTHVVRLSTTTQGVHLDQMCLTDDDGCQPRPLALYDTIPPAATTGLAATKRHPFALELSWAESKDADFSHYNLYRARKKNPQPLQVMRIASPVAPNYLDWGLENNSEYRYCVTCADRRGNESAPSPVVAARTAAIQTRRIQLPVASRVLQKNEDLMWNVNIPEPGTYAVWVKLAATKQGGDGEFEVVVGDHASRWKPNFGIVSIHHSGPSKDIPFWDTVGSSEWGEGDLFRLERGERRITLKLATDHPVRLEAAVVTNDLGFQPEGITSFLPAESPLTTSLP
ncbi:MAG: fibronectin type III domain-containing protein [Verrucomicrobia bacterium]|nr:fibronectin type III domain-containing protein [Verrucomicrobiota bacterium]